MNTDTGSKTKCFNVSTELTVMFIERHLFSIIVDILLTFHVMRRHLTGNEASQAVGMLQAG